jgi:hypothetical protein
MSRPKLFSNFFRVDRIAILAFFFGQLRIAVLRPIGSNRCVDLGRADRDWYVGIGGVEGGVNGGVGEGLEGRDTPWSRRDRRLNKDRTVNDRRSHRKRRSSCLEDVVRGGGGELLGEERNRASARGLKSSGSGGENSVLNGHEMEVNKMLKSIAEDGKIG